MAAGWAGVAAHDTASSKELKVKNTKNTATVKRVRQPSCTAIFRGY